MISDMSSLEETFDYISKMLKRLDERVTKLEEAQDQSATNVPGLAPSERGVKSAET